MRSCQGSPTLPPDQPLGNKNRSYFWIFCEQLSIHFLSAVSQLETLKQSVKRDVQNNNTNINNLTAYFSDLEDCWRGFRTKMEKMCGELVSRPATLPLHRWEDALAFGQMFSAQLLKIYQDNPGYSNPLQQENIRKWEEQCSVWEKTIIGAKHVQGSLKKSIETPMLLFQLTVDVDIIDLFEQWIARRMEWKTLQELVQAQVSHHKTRL